MSFPSRKPNAGTGVQVLREPACRGFSASRPRPRRRTRPLDLEQAPTLFVVNYSHLDTQWRWSYPEVVRTMLAATLYDNFAYMDLHPDYVFNWTGAGRYELCREYHPEGFERLKGYVRQGQWFPAGCAWEECDVLLPSAESLQRQLLMGHRYFLRHFGVGSMEFMLPDCFGYPAFVPSVLAHAGLLGFSTQKLSWGSAVGVPFNLGRWVGPDGASVVAALNPGDYVSHHIQPLGGEVWAQRLEENGQRLGLRVDYMYNGVGDQGGAPFPDSLATVLAGQRTPGEVRVVAGEADLLFRSITPQQREALPSYEGDMLLTEHSTGSLTSQAFMKRLNRECELLAAAAEAAWSAAALLGAGPWPQRELEAAWGLILRNQAHDILPGTSLPKCYEYSWNEGLLAAKALEAAMEDAVGAVAQALDTQVEGEALVVFNPLPIDREDLVEAQLPPSLAEAPQVRALDGQGQPLPTQLVEDEGGRRVLFRARVPSLGFAVFALQAGAGPADPELEVDEARLENARYRATLDVRGELAGLYDKILGRELLAAPMGMVFQQEEPREYPAWNMDWKDRSLPPRAALEGPCRVRVAERGPVRVALEVEREGEGSRFRQSFRLAAGGAGDRLELAHRIDWRSSRCSLKSVLRSTPQDPAATRTWGLGCATFEPNTPTCYEVPTHGWVDLEDASGAYGVTLVTGSKYGCDRPDAQTLRPTLLYTPAVRLEFREQRHQDWGRHHFSLFLAGHAGGWRQGAAPWLSERCEQPLRAFSVARHPGELGRGFSALSLSSPQAGLRAMKKAEEGSDLVLRIQELEGAPLPDLQLRVGGKLRGLRELDGLERPLHRLPLPKDGTLQLDLAPWQTRTLGVKAEGPARLSPPVFQLLPLDYDIRAFTPRELRGEGGMEGQASYPSEQLQSDTLHMGGVPFLLGPSDEAQPCALSCRGQELPLPRGIQAVHLLAASAGGDKEASFQAGERRTTLRVPSWCGRVGSWDNRRFEGDVPAKTYSVDNPLEGIDPAFIKEGRPIWWASHRHLPRGDDIFEYVYLWGLRLEIPAGCTSLRLPMEPGLRIFAATAVLRGPWARSLQPVFADLNERGGDFTSFFEGPFPD